MEYTRGVRFLLFLVLFSALTNIDSARGRILILKLWFFLERRTCLTGLSIFLDNDIHVQSSGSESDMRISPYSALLPERLRDVEEERVCITILPNDKYAGHLRCTSSQDLQVEPCSLNIFCRHHSDDRVAVLCNECGYTYHEKCIDEMESCGCSEVGDCTDQMYVWVELPTHYIASFLPKIFGRNQDFAIGLAWGELTGGEIGFGEEWEIFHFAWGEL